MTLPNDMKDNYNVFDSCWKIISDVWYEKEYDFNNDGGDDGNNDNENMIPIIRIRNLQTDIEYVNSVL